MLLIDKNGIVLSGDRGADLLFGRSCNRRHWVSVFSHYFRESLIADFRDFRNGILQTLVRDLTLDGDPGVWVSIRIERMNPAQGWQFGPPDRRRRGAKRDPGQPAFICFIEDISKRLSAEMYLDDGLQMLMDEGESWALDSSRANVAFLVAIDSSPEGIILFEPDGRIAYFNQVFNQFIKSFMDPLRVEYREEIHEAFANHPDTAEYWAPGTRLASWWSSPSGTLEALVAPDQWKAMRAGRVPDNRMIVSLTDISDLKRQTEELTATLESHGGYVASVSHEFRTPLPVIDSGAQRLIRSINTLLEEDNPDPDLLKAKFENFLFRLRQMRTRVVELTNLIDRILASESLKSGSIKIEASAMNISVSAMDVVDRFEMISLDHPITTSIERDVWVFADNAMIALVLGNLVSNAVKYSVRPGTPIRVSLWTDESRVYFSVEDQGVGIPKDEIRRVFDRFYRASTAGGVAGSGIGLALCRALMEHMNGVIDINSVVGEGTKVVISLPLWRAGSMEDIEDDRDA